MTKKCKLEERTHDNMTYLYCITHKTLQLPTCCVDGRCTFSQLPDDQKIVNRFGQEINFNALLKNCVEVIIELNAIPFKHKHMLDISTEGTFVEIRLCGGHPLYSTHPTHDCYFIYDKETLKQNIISSIISLCGDEMKSFGLLADIGDLLDLGSTSARRHVH